MHEERNEHNEVIRRLLVEAEGKEALDEKLKRYHAEALANPEVASVMQRRIDRNSPCWCRSGRLFKKCCWPQKE